MAYQNFFVTKLYNDISASDDTITLETPPTETSGRLVLEARNIQQREIVRYTGVSGNQITGVVRGQGGTIARSHLAGSIVEMNVTAEDLDEALGLAFAFPTGIILPYGGDTAPSGWLLADGSVVDIADYPVLHAVYGTKYNTGGEDTDNEFRLPDLKGRVPVGFDASQTEFNTLGKKVGAKTHTLSTAEIPSHTHVWLRNGKLNFHGSGSDGTSVGISGGGDLRSTEATGGGGAHNNIQPSITFNYLVKT